VAGGQERTLRRRIRSIQSTRKTTRAMELIAGSRIVRAQQRIVGARPYVAGMNKLAADVVTAPGSSDHRLLGGGSEEGGGVALVAIAADRGLCGAYNTTALRATEERLAYHAAAGRRILLVTVGRRAESYLRFRGHRADHSVTGVTDRPSFEDARRIAALVTPPYEAGEVDLVEIVSTRFLSAGSQRVETETVLPLRGPGDAEVGDAEGGVGGDRAQAGSSEGPGDGEVVDYELEPERDELLEVLAPQLIEARILMALLEASASEHAARQRAMKAATDNADDLITSLRRVMNRVRQDSITTEIMDIVGGAEALREKAAGEGGSAA
jgi:F-type H+-transporting ATPase subunit gamma